jgi:ABC-type transport system involved in multi-copper enzyme maturation permease subunit
VNVRFSISRVTLIAQNTVLEAVRQKLVGFLVVVALAVVASGQFFREFNFGSSELKFVIDFGFGALTFFGSILAIVAAAQLFFAEIENKTALTILARPVLRSEFVLGKFFGVATVLLWFTMLVTGSLAVVLWAREGEIAAAMGEARLVDYAGVFSFAAVQWLKFSLIAAITIFIASFSTTNLFTVAMSFFVLVVCHLQFLARDAWSHLDSVLAKAAVAFLGLVFPNFQLFNFGDRVAGGRGLPAELAATAAGYALIYVAVILALAVFSFRKREI